MTAVVHRIRRQCWQATAATPADAFALRGVLRRVADGAGSVIVSEAFDAQCPPGTSLYVPRLELRLRITAGEDVEQQILMALRTELARSLAAVPHPGTGAATPSPDRAALTEVDVLLYYLRRGNLPWHAHGSETHLTLQRLRRCAAELAVQVVRTLQGLPAQDRRDFVRRWLQLLPASRWPEVLTIGRARTPIPDLLPPSESQTRPYAATPAPEQLEATVASVLEALCGAGESAAVENPKSAQSEQPMQAPLGALPHFTGDADMRQRHTAPAGSATPIAATPERFATASEHTAWSAPHAGLVLLHPFLPTLFQAVELTNTDARGLIPMHLPRAAALLHWLATGEEEVLEYELTGIKALLGLTPDHPLPLCNGLLQARDREEGAALLTACIGHWPALKGTSVGALRLSFLQRRGLLRDTGDAWTLHLESESFDMLLGALPWSLSTVKLPWMIKPLFTHWPPV